MICEQVSSTIRVLSAEVCEGIEQRGHLSGSHKEQDFQTRDPLTGWSRPLRLRVGVGTGVCLRASGFSAASKPKGTEERLLEPIFVDINPPSCFAEKQLWVCVGDASNLYLCLGDGFRGDC